VKYCWICGTAHVACKGRVSGGDQAITLEVVMADTRYTADRRLYLDRDGNVVEADSPDRATLLVAEGGTLSTEDAARYGLNQGAKRVGQPGPEDPEVAADMEDGSADQTVDSGAKSRRAPANKAARAPREDK
jgi:hypothetical protein